MNHAIYYQRMSPGKGAPVGGGPPPPPPTVSVVGITSATSSINEGDSIQYTINRSNNLNTNCSVDWTASSGAGTADFTGATSGKVTFTPTGGQSQTITVNTVKRTGLQGDRSITVILGNFVGCEVDPTASGRSVLVKDVIPPPVDPPPVDPPVDPPPGGTDGPVNGFAPSAPPAFSDANTLKVPEDYTIDQAIAAVNPGQQISVADGYSIPTKTISRNMSSTNWTVLRSRNVNKAIMSGRLTVSGTGWWIHGFKFTYSTTNGKDSGEAPFTLRGNYCTLTRNSFKSSHSCFLSTVNANHHVWIGWNTFDGMSSGGEVFWVTIPGAGNFSSTSQGPNNWDIYRNDFFDSEPRNGNPDDHCIYLGESHPEGSDVLSLDNFNIRQNWHRPTSRRKRGFYLKRGCHVTQNTLSGDCYNCGWRHGGYNVFESNIVENASICTMSGPHYSMFNNLFQGGTKLCVNSGNGDSATGYAGPPYQAADYAEIDGNTGPVVVGYKAGKVLNSTLGGKCDHVTIYKHSGNISFVDGYYDPDTYRNTGNSKGLTYLPRFRLGEGDVGQFGK